MVTKYFLVYLLYGFFMLNMGIFCLKEKGVNFNRLSLLRSLKYLGWFGILHGLSEWVTLVNLTQLYPEYFHDLYHLAQILKALSFSFLMGFGFDLMPWKEPWKRLAKGIPAVLMIVYSAGYFLLIQKSGSTYHLENPKFSILMMRYVLAFFGSVVSALALGQEAKAVRKEQSDKISRRYLQLAGVLLLNGLLEGLLVQKSDFFPANLLNRDVFHQIFRLEALFPKAFVGLLIYYVIMRLMATYSREQEEHLRELETQRIISEERNRMNLEIHDGLIQSLFAMGLKLEYVMQTPEGSAQGLHDMKKDLNATIEQTRNLITSTALEVVAMDELNQKIGALVQQYQENQNLKINYVDEVPPQMKKRLSPEKSTQIYYIVQEALCNVVKHSGAQEAEVVLKAQKNLLNLSIKDNGVGIRSRDFHKSRHVGIESMMERAHQIGGRFEMGNQKKGRGLEVSITGIPGEDQDE